MEKENIEKLIDQIVATHFKDELPVYELDKEDLFNEAWKQNYQVQEYNQFEGINRAATGVESILSCISTLIGTVKTVFEISKLAKKDKEVTKKNPALDFVAEKWIAELQLAGLPAEKAKLIGSEFTSDLEKLLQYDK